jgi:hypothetical protein
MGVSIDLSVHDVLYLTKKWLFLSNGVAAVFAGNLMGGEMEGERHVT